MFSDLGEEHGYTVRRGVGHYRGTDGPAPEVHVELSRETFELTGRPRESNVVDGGDRQEASQDRWPQSVVRQVPLVL
jgi:hypothetical protein